MTRIRIDITTDTSPLYRVLHDVELGALWRQNVPEVYRLSGGNTMPITKPWQLLIKAMNPTMTNLMWRRLLDWQRAFTNNTAGYDYPGGEPLQDWVNLRDLNATGVPRFEIPRICGGAVVTGVVDGSDLIVSTLDGNAMPPRVEDIKPWHKFVALNVKDETTLTKFPQGEGADVWIPLVTRQPVSYPLSKLQRWTDVNLPNPYRIYIA